MSKTKGNVHTSDVMKESVLRFAVHVARRSHVDRLDSHTYPEHVDKDERQRRDALRLQIARTSDDREWALVESLAQRFGVNLKARAKYLTA